MYASIVDPRASPLSPLHYSTPKKPSSGVENGKVWVLRVALPSHRQEKSAQRGGGEWRTYSKREQSGFYKSYLKVHHFLATEIVNSWSLKKITRKILLAFNPFTPRPSYGEMTRCFNLHLWAF